MSYGELIRLYFERSNALQWYWTLYVVVIGGLLAFSSLRQQPDLLTAALVTVLYCFFAYKNLGAIRNVTMQRLAVLELIKQTPAVAPAATQTLQALEALQYALDAPDYAGVRNFHIASDLLTIAAVWAMEWRRRRHATASARPPETSR